MHEGEMITKLTVPTYRPNGTGDKEYDYSTPNIVELRNEVGCRVILGEEKEPYEKPDLVVERRAKGWAIFIHPIGGADCVGCVFITDEGKAYCVPDGIGDERIDCKPDWDTVEKEIDG